MLGYNVSALFWSKVSSLSCACFSQKVVPIPPIGLEMKALEGKVSENVTKFKWKKKHELSDTWLTASIAHFFLRVNYFNSSQKSGKWVGMRTSLNWKKSLLVNETSLQRISSFPG